MSHIRRNSVEGAVKPQVFFPSLSCEQSGLIMKLNNILTQNVQMAPNINISGYGYGTYRQRAYTDKCNQSKLYRYS